MIDQEITHISFFRPFVHVYFITNIHDLNRKILKVQSIT